MTAEGEDERPMSLSKRPCTQTSPLRTSSLVGGGVEEGVDIGGGLAIGAKDQSTDRRLGSQGREDRADGRSHSAVVIVVEAPGPALVRSPRSFFTSKERPRSLYQWSLLN